MPRRMNDILMAQRWAIQPDFLPLMAAIAQRDRIEVDRIAAELGRSGWTEAARRQAINFRGGTGFGITVGSRIRDGVAILPITGPIFPHANMMTEMSGATALETVARDFATALDRDDVRGVLLEINSPGGVVGGPGEFARAVMSRESEKPVWAYTGGLCCSAAYWIAAGADRIIAADDTVIGNIGVVIMTSKQESVGNDGYRDYEIVSSHAENKRPDPATDQGRAEIVRELDEIEAVFHRDVAVGRGVSVEAVISEFGRGGCFAGAEALARGMIDALGSFESAVAELSGQPMGVLTRGQPGSRADSHITTAPGTRETRKSDMDWKSITAEQLESNRPDLAAAISQAKVEAALAAQKTELTAAQDAAIAEARVAAGKEAVAAEQARIAGIDALAVPGCEALIAEMKADAAVTPEMAAVKVVAAVQKSGTTALTALKGDDQDAPAAGQPNESGLPVIRDSASLTGMTPDAAAAKASQDYRAQGAHGDKIRAEYPTEQEFVAYRQQLASGLLKDKNPL